VAGLNDTSNKEKVELKSNRTSTAEYYQMGKTHVARGWEFTTKIRWEMLIKPLFHWLPCETLLQGHCLSDWTGKVEEEFFAKT